MKRKTSFKHVTFTYDFTVDGGAISIIPMGVFIPENCLLTTYCLQPIINLASGGAALVSIGIVGVGNFITSGNAYTDYDIATGAAIGNNNCIQSSFATPIAGEIFVRIQAFVLTAGQFDCTIFYIEYTN